MISAMLVSSILPRTRAALSAVTAAIWFTFCWAIVIQAISSPYRVTTMTIGSARANSRKATPSSEPFKLWSVFRLTIVLLKDR
ncbi:hypothetical protein [Sphingomonas parva]|uniref:hypothetical protein n=1 Tax=Sphingomonas parva TaxID=2555898 RepID=UPI0021F06F4F|nr:hypothetical protein [Sphingomonas parva]